MRNTFILLAAAALLLAPASSRAMCSCFPCDDCVIVNSGQATFVVFDREGGTVGIIPNILITGPAATFALIVPTPVVPELTPVDKGLWTQVSQLTAAPIRTFSGGDNNLGCSQAVDEAVPAGDSGTEVIVTRTVGSFIATTIRSSDSRSLVAWLLENDFEVTESEAQILARYVAREWVFTAMKLDPSSPESQVPNDGWNVNVNPVEFRYAATDVEVPLDLLSINRSDFFPVRFYVVDDHRMTLDGFQTNYANRLSDKEFEAIGETYPLVADRLASGRFLTRLERTYTSDDPTTGTLMFGPAAIDEEVFWPDRAAPGPVFPLESLVFFLLPAGLLRRRPGR